MASLTYNSYFVDVQNAEIDLTDDTIKIMLTTSTYTPDRDTHTKHSDITNEIAGAGYVAGGNTLANVVITQDNANNRGKFDADDTTWASSTITNARYAVIYKDTGVSATSPLIDLIDFGVNKSSSNGDFTITFNADGIHYVDNA